MTYIPPYEELSGYNANLDYSILNVKEYKPVGFIEVIFFYL
jgi:hypothetical protein